MSYLGIENEVADEVILADEWRGILTKVMKNFHDQIGLHYFFKSIAERIYRL